MRRLSKPIVFAIFFMATHYAMAFTFNENNCLDGQDLSAEDVDISLCPTIPRSPNDFAYHMIEKGLPKKVSLGGWELEKTKEGDTYAIGTVNSNDGTFSQSDSTDELNLQCWAKNYYRLRAILRNPPEAYTKLREKGRYRSFFQYQVDHRVGSTGFAKGVRPYKTHLIKWVSIIESDGTCNQTTYDEFKNLSVLLLEKFATEEENKPT